MHVKVVSTPAVKSKMVAITNDELAKSLKEKLIAKQDELLGYAFIVKGTFVGSFKYLPMVTSGVIELKVIPEFYNTIDKYLQSIDLKDISAISLVQE